MGRVRHDAIVVTSCFEDHIARARDFANSLGLQTTGITPEAVNGYRSFLIAPDGSKEGWNDSDAGDDLREKWKLWARANGEESAPRPCHIEWVHVRYSDDDGGAAVEDHKWSTL